MLRGKGYLLLVPVVFLITGCVEEDDIKAIDDAFNPPVQEEPLPDDRIDNKLCKVDKFYQPEAEVVRKIDLLFVVDTSGSLNDEREEVADGIDAFIQELPSNVDFQIGVLLAHGDKSAHSGKLYSKDTNPKVLNPYDYSMQEIRKYLRENMTRTVSDSDTDAGEAGIYSLSRALTDGLPHNQELGFFRNDSALAIVFVSDENDICSWTHNTFGVTFKPDPNGKEKPAAKKYCGSLTTEAAYEIVKKHQKSRPTLISGIIYTDETKTPTKGENEVGYGYIELIEKSNGLAIDLADGEYDLGMREIGFLATKKLNLLTDFKISEEKFDKNSLDVEVDRQPVPFKFIEETNEVQIDIEDAGREYSEVVVSYCQPILEDPIKISNIQFSEYSTTTVTVTWETKLRATSKVIFEDSITGEAIESETVSFLDNYHSVDMSGLKPGTTYNVTVISTIPTNLGTEQDRETKTFVTPL